MIETRSRIWMFNSLRGWLLVLWLSVFVLLASNLQFSTVQLVIAALFLSVIMIGIWWRCRFIDWRGSRTSKIWRSAGYLMWFPIPSGALTTSLWFLLKDRPVDGMHQLSEGAGIIVLSLATCWFALIANFIGVVIQVVYGRFHRMPNYAAVLLWVLVILMWIVLWAVIRQGLASS